jgi:hypothetical protein
MPQFLIEVPHSKEMETCVREVKVFLSSGSHFLTNAHWGCMDGVHCAWIVVEAADKDEARMIVPPLFRPQAKIIGLNKFSMDQIDAIIAKVDSQQVNS